MRLTVPQFYSPIPSAFLAIPSAKKPRTYGLSSMTSPIMILRTWDVRNPVLVAHGKQSVSQRDRSDIRLVQGFTSLLSSVEAGNSNGGRLGGCRVQQNIDMRCLFTALIRHSHTLETLVLTEGRFDSFAFNGQLPLMRLRAFVNCRPSMLTTEFSSATTAIGSPSTSYVTFRWHQQA